MSFAITMQHVGVDEAEVTRRQKSKTSETQRAGGGRRTIERDKDHKAQTIEPAGSISGRIKKSTRKPLDDYFVFFLISYAADEECHPELRRLLTSGLLDKDPDRLQKIARIFRSPLWTEFIKGKLKDKVDQYDLDLPNTLDTETSKKQTFAREEWWRMDMSDTVKSTGEDVKTLDTETSGQQTAAVEEGPLMDMSDHTSSIGKDTKKLDTDTSEQQNVATEKDSRMDVSDITRSAGKDVEKLDFSSSRISPSNTDEAASPTTKDNHAPGHPSREKVLKVMQRLKEAGGRLLTETEELEATEMMEQGQEGLEEKKKAKAALDLEKAIRLRFGDATEGDQSTEYVDSDEDERAVSVLKRHGKEWKDDSSYKGTRQPPLGIRMEHVLNFLREEDVDRCLNWDTKLQEVIEYLDWLRNGDADGQLDACGPEVKNMYDDAVIKVKIHQQFEKFHYSKTPLKFAKTPLPRDPKRLAWMSGMREMAVQLLPRPSVEETGRPPLNEGCSDPVNTMFPPRGSEGADFQDMLRKDEQSYWRHENTPSDNLFAIENATYEDLRRRGMGWILTDPATGEKQLPYGLPLDPAARDTLARERGARRAGLQLVLRSFGAVEQQMVASRWRQVSLPLPAAELQAVRARLEKNMQWLPGRMEIEGAAFEPWPYTVGWREHARKLHEARDWLGKRAMPLNVVRSAPLVRIDGLDAKGQRDAEMLRRCEAAYASLQLAQKRRTGPGAGLLDAVTDLCRSASMGNFGLNGAGSAAPMVNLRPEDWENTDYEDEHLAGPQVRAISETGLEWLHFLAGKCYNEKELKPLKETGRLFRIFAKRVAKVIDDKYWWTLFPTNDCKLTVEELLDAINKSLDGPVKKEKFSVKDAMCFLPRLDKQGRLLFTEDLECYGIVRPSPKDVYPEMLVEPFFKPESGAPLSEPDIAFYDLGKFEKPGEESRSAQRGVAQFFRNLGMRLGLTILRLRSNIEEQRRAAEAQREIIPDPMSTEETQAGVPPDPGSRGIGPEQADIRSLGAADLDELAKIDATLVEERIVPALPKLLQKIKGDYSAEANQAVASLTDADALNILRSLIISESAAGHDASMLARGRYTEYDDATRGERRAIFKRDHNWDWAAARGARQFWSLDRWPVEFQSAETARRIRADKDWEEVDPRKEDDTSGTYVAPKLRRYGSQKSRHRPGPAFYMVGDTPLARRAFEGRIEARAREGEVAVLV